MHNETAAAEQLEFSVQRCASIALNPHVIIYQTLILMRDRKKFDILVITCSNAKFTYILVNSYIFDISYEFHVMFNIYM